MAIAYGFNNVKMTIPRTNCIAHQVIFSYLFSSFPLLSLRSPPLLCPPLSPSLSTFLPHSPPSLSLCPALSSFYLRTSTICILYNSTTLAHYLPSVLFTFQLPVNKLTDQLRVGVAQAGFTEALTFALVYNFVYLFIFKPPPPYSLPLTVLQR